MSIGIRNFFRKASPQTVAASTALVDCTDLICPVAANQKVNMRIFVPFTLGASGGYKFQITVPAGGVAYKVTYYVIDAATATPVFVEADTLVASAAFANALAVAGTHQLYCEVDIENGTTAGNITLQFACNSAANSIIVGTGAYMDVVKL